MCSGVLKGLWDYEDYEAPGLVPPFPPDTVVRDLCCLLGF